jgi:hypothetical protein
MPACTALFLRGDVEPARKKIRVALTYDGERAQLHESLDPWQLTAERFGADPRLALEHATLLQLNDRHLATRPDMPGEEQVFVSDTNQLRWDVSQQDAGYFVADTLKTKLFTGFVNDRTFVLGDARLEIGSTRLDWATVSMVAVDGEGFGDAGRVLIAATGLVQNTGAELEELGGDRVTLGREWGSEPVLCEGIPAEIRLPVPASRVNVYPLDESGNRKKAVACDEADGAAIVLLDPAHRTLWYEVEIR